MYDMTDLARRAQRTEARRSPPPSLPANLPHAVWLLWGVWAPAPYQGRYPRSPGPLPPCCPCSIPCSIQLHHARLRAAKGCHFLLAATENAPLTAALYPCRSQPTGPHRHTNGAASQWQCRGVGRAPGLTPRYRFHSLGAPYYRAHSPCYRATYGQRHVQGVPSPCTPRCTHTNSLFSCRHQRSRASLTPHTVSSRFARTPTVRTYGREPKVPGPRTVPEII